MPWEPVESWEAEQPQQCTVCGETMVGRELGYRPLWCDEEDCPGLPDRLHVTVTPDLDLTNRAFEI